MTDAIGHDVVTSVGAQITAITAAAIAVAWWGRRVAIWIRKMKVWSDAVAQERFAERAAQYVAATIAPRFDQLDDRLGVVEESFKSHLTEAVRRRVREDQLYVRLEEHMEREDARDPDTRRTP